MKLCVYQIYWDSFKKTDFSFYDYLINISNFRGSSQPGNKKSEDLSLYTLC